MKKALTLLMALLFVLALSSCGMRNGNADAGTTHDGAVDNYTDNAADNNIMNDMDDVGERIENGANAVGDAIENAGSGVNDFLNGDDHGENGTAADNAAGTGQSENARITEKVMEKATEDDPNSTKDLQKNR